MGRDLCSGCGRELPNDTGTYCPVCGEPRRTGRVTRDDDADVRKKIDQLEETLERIGELHVALTFGRAEGRSKGAYDTIMRRTKGLSCWRFIDRPGSPDEAWCIVIMGETKNRREFAKARTIAARKGARPADIPAHNDPIPALRERRRQHALQAALTGANPKVKTHFGKRGAHLYRDATMRPASRPQG